MAELLADVLLYGGFLIAQLLRQGVYFGQQRLDARGQFVLTCLADFWGCFFQVLRQCGALVRLLPEVVREVGKDATVMVDTGIMHGADIVASMALGAKFTLIGRAYLYGLMAGGRRGVDRTIEILSAEIIRTMQLLGVSTLDELEPSHVTQLVRLEPRAR